MKDLALNSCYETTFIGQTFKVLPSRAQDSTLSACPTTAGANKRSMPRTAKTKKRIILDTTEEDWYYLQYLLEKAQLVYQ